MKQRLLTYLVCPQCASGFSLDSSRQEGGEILEGSLLCSGCAAGFPIIRGIPRFLPPELSAAKRATAAAFGYEWTHYTELTRCRSRRVPGLDQAAG